MDLHTSARLEPRSTLDRARDIVRRAHGISPSPSLLRLESQLRGGNATARQLAGPIEGSPALAARVLRMANSAFYAPREPVVGLSRAVAILGDTILRQLVLTSLIVSRQAGSRSPRQSLATARLMGDAVRSAATCRALAELTKLAEPDEAFSAGLLHDLGHVYLLDEVGDEYAGYLLDPSSVTGWLEREVALAGTTHQEVGAVFAYEWNLPPQVADSLQSHHRPTPGTLLSIVHASDWFVRELNNPAVAVATAIQERVDESLADLGLDRSLWAERVPLVRQQYAELLTLFDAIAA